jgi:hypothetical protein
LPSHPQPKNIKIKKYRNIILFLFLYEYETWSIRIKEEHRLSVFENGMLRRIFRRKKDEMIGGCRKVHIGKLCNLCFLPDIIRMIWSRRIR